MIKFIVEKEDTSSKDGNAKKTVIMKGPVVADELNNKLKVGQDILKVGQICSEHCRILTGFDYLQLQVIELDTVVCQNDCSGHGKCQQSTRECICEPFWIENPVRRTLMDGKKNCGEK